MATEKNIIDEVIWANELKILVETYEEIAAMRMRKTRSSVLQNRKFNAGLIEVFHQLKESYKKEWERLNKNHKNNKSLSVLKRNGKTVAVLVSANAGLYGEVINDTFNLFADYCKSHDSDLVIIGKIGNGLFKESFPQKQFTYFDFPDNQIDQPALNKIVSFLVNFEQVLVFYAQFESVTVQKPTMLDLYGQDEPASSKAKPSARYIFEPSLETILLFFETQIYASFFEQMLAESQLAKFASRMSTLDTASENIKKYLHTLSLNANNLRHREQAKKQQNKLSSISLWMK